jgi:carbamoyl-phosphate synthase large subunit
VNVLITSLSRKVPLLKAFQQALSRSASGGTVWGADSDPECVGRYFADRFWSMPKLDAADAAQDVLAQCAREQIGLLIPTRDGELPFFAGLRVELAGQGTYTPVPSPEAVDVCLDKLRFHEHCERVGLATAPTSTAIDNLSGERFVVKERFGMGSRELAVGLDRDRARDHGRRLSAPIFQPLLDGTEHSVDVYVNRSGEVVEVAPRVRIRVHDGEATVTETVEHPELVSVAARLATSLELRGHLVIQAFVRGSEVTLIECNPRVGGASALGFSAGVETPRWAIQEALGETVEPRLGSYRRGLRLVRYPTDRLLEP